MELLCRISGLRMIRRYNGLNEKNFPPETPNLDWVIYLVQLDGREKKDRLSAL
jgi:hypothetical protein